MRIVKAIILVVLAVLILALGACLYQRQEGDVSAPPQVQEALPAEETPPAPVEGQVPPPAAAGETAEPSPAESLNLSVPPYVTGEEEDGADFSARPEVLPDLFKSKAKEKEKAMSVSATPILGEENPETSVPKVVGGTVEVEVKLK
jgi:hypothetical protein